MTTPATLQDLLRFLAQDAKIPLPAAMARIKDLQKANLTNPAILATTPLPALTTAVTCPKLARQISTAAKRLAKKRSAPAGMEPSPPKRTKCAAGRSASLASSGPAHEAALALPASRAPDAVLAATVLRTNRAPLVLAFAVALLAHTMPRQPLSARLSLAQAVVALNSRSKAVSLGLEAASAEREGWGAGQPSVWVMGREVRVLRRWGAEAVDGEAVGVGGATAGAHGEVKVDGEGLSQATQTKGAGEMEGELALWGLDLEALKSSKAGGALPIHTAESARAYLLKSFLSVPAPEGEGAKAPAKKKTAAAVAAERENNLALLLAALEGLYASWVFVLDAKELDRRAWGWYLQVRPDVPDGVAGWGGKGEVRLSDILNLRRIG